MNLSTAHKDFGSGDEIEQSLVLLDRALAARSASPFEIVVVGGAALSVLGFCIRPTRDVDVVALAGEPNGVSEIALLHSRPLPDLLSSAAGDVSRALGVAADWLNPGPADLLECGLPDGFEGRMVTRRYGNLLTVHYASRLDLIHLKVYAAADMGVGRHTEDLRSLGPTCDELLAGARWARTHDPSAGFTEMLVQLLRHMGCEQSAEVLSREDRAA
ncbi:MAG: hypothetical protein IBX63_11315 [Coriobacteriia bacterium]|nr:hypothetical protein [Coriobacteriia bacterium]